MMNVIQNVINIIICYTKHLSNKCFKYPLTQIRQHKSQADLFSLRMIFRAKGEAWRWLFAG